MDLIHPASKADVVDAVGDANASARRLLVVGGRRHLDKGNPSEVDAELWTTQLDRLVSYEPAEMIAVVEAGMRVGELRRIYNSVSQTLGYRELSQFTGGDVYQLKIMLNALGFYKKGETVARGGDANLYTAETVEAVNAFRESEKMGTPRTGGSPPGLVDAETVEHLWAALEKAGKAAAVRQALLDITMIRR